MTEAEALVKKNNCSSLRIDFFFHFYQQLIYFVAGKDVQMSTINIL